MKSANKIQAYAIPHGDQFTYLGQTFCIRSDVQDVMHRPQEEIVIDWIREHEENEPIYPSAVLDIDELDALSAEIEQCVGEFSALTDGLSSWVRKIIRRYTKLAPVEMPDYPSQVIHSFTGTFCQYGDHVLNILATREMVDGVLNVSLDIYVDGKEIYYGDDEDAANFDIIWNWCWAESIGAKLSDQVLITAVCDIVDKYLAGLLKSAA
jgi:hypothetical protein